MKERDTLLFTYHNSSVYRGDAQSLRDGQWLNDSILSFYFEYIRFEILKNDPGVLLLKPAQVQLLQTENGRESALPADMLRMRFIMVPIGSGTHWSLLVFIRHSQQPAEFHYFDSMANANYHFALNVKRKLERVLTKGEHIYPLSMATHSCPQQENSYDCGIFVVLFADLLARRYADLHVPIARKAKAVSFSHTEIIRATNDIAQRSQQPWAQLAPDGSTQIEKLLPSAFQTPAIDRTFWWIDYGDLSNPNTARATLLKLVEQHRACK
ncbi:hypothetical protein H4R22_001544 [Coemansia sp. RSA 1290]|nr:hypothetical protein BX667DRAFT_165 [Coemansia mojavensis]KAJ1739629.1 hypothetical protein LPJ68_004525 [Coemansia sp. RSA 1086]KAJ1748075.1 hypothetical protein LPJ79_004819 [Coemansia sp. RSA 1821]KAJ2632045.1 hypothetical protein H4R22_001544 [Coemansia sp. RSA 1290]KAJ2646225.1 hypothetical protein IWW40_005564 [Coemansia sp. RSA 1250]